MPTDGAKALSELGQTELLIGTVQISAIIDRHSDPLTLSALKGAMGEDVP